MIRNDVKQTTAAHKFVRVLRDRGKLARCYTQNIDGLEAREDLCMEMERGKGNRLRFSKMASVLTRTVVNTRPGGNLDGGCEVVQLHGDLMTLRCTICQKTFSWDEENREETCLDGRTPNCPKCMNQDQNRRDRGKRGTPIGTLRPNIVLYGEEHPSADMLSSIATHDISLKPEVLLILGTSLKVHGLKALVKEFAKSVHASGKGGVIFVNLTKPPHSVWDEYIDYWVGMDCDEWVKDVRIRRPNLWQKQAELELKITKDVQPQTPRKSKDSACAAILDGEEENRDPTTTPTRILRTPLKSPSKIPQASLRTPRSKLASISANTINTPTRSASSLVNEMVKPLSSEAIQLLTPPDSKRKYRGEDTLGHEMGRINRSDAIAFTPSKRRKTEVAVWEDGELSSPGPKADSTVQPVWLDGRRMSNIEVHVPSSSSENSFQSPSNKKRKVKDLS